jgi:endonuclease/exonuclease/phosphatase (EEP) superfamily protein YafD
MSRWIREISKPSVVGIKRQDNMPIIVCGDFNDIPSSSAYDVMLGSYKSAYPDNEEHYTTFKVQSNVVKRCIDYIFYTPESLNLERRLEIPSSDVIPYPHLPNIFHPSDHLHLIAEFGLK